MLIPILIASAAAMAVLASIVMSRAGNRPCGNMVLGGVLAVAVLAGALMIAFLFTTLACPELTRPCCDRGGEVVSLPRSARHPSIEIPGIIPQPIGLDCCEAG